MVAIPEPTLVTRPSALMVATLVLSIDHVTGLSVPETSIWKVGGSMDRMVKSVRFRLRLAELTQGSPVTVTEQVTVSSPAAAVMVTVPPATPVTEPFATVAIFSLELLQVTSPVPPVAVSRAVSPAGMVMESRSRARGPAGSWGTSGSWEMSSPSSSGVAGAWVSSWPVWTVSGVSSVWFCSVRMPIRPATWSPKNTKPTTPMMMTAVTISMTPPAPALRLRLSRRLPPLRRRGLPWRMASSSWQKGHFL